MSKVSPRSSSSLGPPLRIVDTMPEFWEFWDRSAGRGREAQIALFREMIIERHPELYTAKVLLGDDGPPEPRLANKVTAFLDEAPARVSVMRRLAKRLPGELRRHAGRFLSTFRDFQYEGAIYLLVSLRSFDGAIRKIGGERCLLFGLDEIARVHGENADLTVLFDHELFHIYHSAVCADWEREPSPLWHSLWAEGLATHVSEVLNPETPSAVVLGSPADLEERARPILPALARELRAKLDSTETRDYADFFFGSIDRSDIPPRSGYYVGVLVARSICSAVPLPEAARFAGKGLRQRIDRELELIAS